MKTILHLGAGKLMVTTIRHLKNAGYKVAVVDADPHSPGFKFADYSSAIDIKNIDNIEIFARAHNIDCIIAVNDAGVNAASIVSDRLGLNYISPEVAVKATDKGFMRQAWEDAGCPQPKFKIAYDESEIKEAISEIGYPLVLKPCSNWGSKGVSVINNDEEREFSIRYALTNNRNGRFIIEKKIEGIELTVEGLVLHGNVSILATSDKMHQSHPQFCVAMQLNYPAEITETQYEQLTTVIQKSIAALGLDNCAFHCECIHNAEGIYLVEMAGRPGGGHIFGSIVEAASGISMPVALAQILCGDQPEIKAKFNRGVTYRFFSPPQGTFRKIENLNQARRLDGVLELGFDMPAGTIVNAIAGDADRPGYMVTTANDRNASIDVSNRVMETLVFKMD
jgi:biotin carboxylase